MLNEFTTKNTDLDHTIHQLHADIRDIETKHLTELADRDRLIETLRNDLTASKAQETEVCVDRDSLRDEMTALSQAYTSLEVEYRRQANTTVKEVEDTEEHPVVSQQQLHGEDLPPSTVTVASPDTDSTEATTLRAENARMRQEAQAADEWMSMAVDRMDAMTNEITSLQEQVTSLNALLFENSATGDSGSELASVLSQEKEVRFRLEGELAQLTRELSTVHGHHEQLEQQLREYRNDIETSSRTVAEVIAARDQLQEDVTKLTEQLDLLQQNQNGKSEVDSAQSNELLSRQNTVENMKNQIINNHTEMESNVQRERLEISARDARIQELEEVVAAKDYKNDEQIETLEQEILQLNEANESAQNWMSKAVEHHQMLSGQITLLTQENADLRDQLNQVERSSDPRSPDVTSDLQAEIASRDLEILKLSESLAQREAEIQQSQSQFGNINELERELSEMRSHLDALRAQSMSKDEEIETLRNRMSASNLVNDYEERSFVVESLQSELADRTDQVRSLIIEIEELRTSHRELQEKVDDLETVRIEAGTKEEEILALRARMAESEARKEAIQNILVAVAKEKEELTMEYDKNQHALEKIESELNKVRSGDLDTTQSSEIEENMEELQATIKTLEAQLVSQCAEATGVVQQWKVTHAALQSDRNDLESKLQLVLDQKTQLDLDLNESMQVAVKLQEDIEFVKDGYGAQISELETLIENLKDQMADEEKDANDTLNQWQESYNEIESNLNSAMSEIESLKTQLQEAEEYAASEIESLKAQLLETEEKAASEVESLKAQLQEAEEKAVSEIESLKAQLQEEKAVSEIESMKAQLQEAEEKAVSDIESMKVQLQEAEAKAVTEIESMKAQLHEAEAKIQNVASNQQVEQEFTQHVKNLEVQIADQEQLASEVVTRWQDSYNIVEASLNDAIIENENLKSELISFKERENTSKGKMMDSSEGFSENNEDQMAELVLQIKNLEEQLSHQEQEANYVVLQWQDSYNGIVEEKRALMKQLDVGNVHGNDSSGGDEGVPLEEAADTAQSQQRIEELEQAVKQLEEQLVIHEEEASTVVAQWEQCYYDAMAQVDVLSSDLQLTKDAPESLQVQSDSKIIDAEPDILTSHENTVTVIDEHLQEQHLVQSRTIDDSLNWQERYNNVLSELEIAEKHRQDLEKDVSSLRQRLEAQTEQSYKESSQWQESFDNVSANSKALEEDKKLLHDEIERLTETLSHLQLNFDEVSAKAERVNEMNQQLSDSALTVHNLQQQLDALNDIVNQWQESHSHVTDELKSTMLELQERRDSSAAQQRQLDDACSNAESFYTELQERKKQAEIDSKSLQILEEKLKKQEFEVGAWKQQHADIDAAHEKTLEDNAQLRSNLRPFEQQCEAYEQSVAQVNELSETVSVLKEQIHAHSEERRLHHESFSNLQGTLEEEKAELLRISSDLADSTENRLKAETALQELEKQLMEQEVNAHNIVMQWQHSYDMLQAHCEEAIAELEESREAVSRLTGQIDDIVSSRPSTEIVGSEVVGGASQERLRLLQSKVDEVEDQLVKDAENAQNVVEQWEAQYQTVSSDLVFALGENEALNARLQKAEEALHYFEQRNTDSNAAENDGELQLKVDELIVSLERIQFEKLELQSQVETWTSDFAEQRKPDSSSATKDSELQLKIDELVVSLDHIQSEKLELKSQIEILTNDGAERQSKIEGLRMELSELQELTPQLKSEILTLETRIIEHLESIAHLGQELDNSRKEKDQMLAHTTKLSDDFVFQVDKLKSDQVRMKNASESQHAIDLAKIEKIEVEIENTRRENSSLVLERDTLTMQLAEMDDKLLEASDRIQLLTTDLASKKASEIAADALREQIQSMYHQAQVDRETLIKMSQARDAAEAEVDRHRNDLATFLGLADYEGNRPAIEQRTMEATEALQRAERNEITALKSSLSRALDELAMARASEKELEERAAKATHQAYMYEQEVINTKSDFKFLTQTMDEMRESESSRRMSLEYRISSLENEHNVLRHFHTTEIDHVRNELSHVTMERDRLYQALIESEKSKEILLQAPSRDIISNGGDGDPYFELNRLRMEKAQLLSNAAEEASRMEHRLREAHAAAKAAADADIFVERELRIQAEKNLERNLIEMSELRMVGMDHRHGSYNVEVLEQRLERSQNELLKMKNETQSLRSECTSLRSQLQDTKKESNMTIARLTEEFGQAKARASHLEREGRYEAEVRVEVSRLQAAAAAQNANSNLLNDDNATERRLELVRKSTNNPALDDDDRDDGGGRMYATKLYDALQQQKRAAEEDRIVYFELISEHDDLLALLAQQDLVKGCLKRALMHQCGSETVDAAIQEAEEKAQMLYGKYIKLN
jgi:chromosome segregation ATPase